MTAVDAGGPVVTGPPPDFQGTVQRIPADLRQLMVGDLWHRGCPVPIRKLRLLTLDYYDFDGVIRDGYLVVHRKEAGEVLAVFEVLYDRSFPMERVVAHEEFAADDEKYDRHNVTSAFNCRTIVGGSSNWSQHAYGLAVDVNPVQNPYVNGHNVIPREGRTYRDRSQDLPGMIHKGDFVVHAFRTIGWKWGGNWNSLKDYIHFSENGH